MKNWQNSFHNVLCSKGQNWGRLFDLLELLPIQTQRQILVLIYGLVVFIYSLLKFLVEFEHSKLFVAYNVYASSLNRLFKNRKNPVWHVACV